MTKRTPETFDALARDAHTHTRAREGRIIWTLKAIGQCVGRGPAYAKALAERPGSPIRRDGRQFYADREELLAYMTQRSETAD